MNNAAKLIAVKLQSRKNASSKTAARIAAASIILSLTVVTLAIAITDGFSYQIQHRIRTLTADYTLQGHDAIQQMMADPIDLKAPLTAKIQSLPGVETLYPVSSLNVVAQNAATTVPLALQGVDARFPAATLLQPYMVDGAPLPASVTDSALVVIPARVAQALGKRVGDELEFIVFSVVPIKFTATIHGTFATGLDEADKALAFIPLQTVALLRNQEPDHADQLNLLVADDAPADFAQSLETALTGENVLLSSTAERFPQVFDWIAMLQNNVTLILIIMIIVAAIAMTGAILAIILENTATIGLLKALGMPTRSIVGLFVASNLRIVVPSALVGVGLAILIALLQSTTGLLSLDAGAYMLAQVPVHLNVLKITTLLVASVVLLAALSIIPTLIIARLQPVKCLKFS